MRIPVFRLIAEGIILMILIYVVQIAFCRARKGDLRTMMGRYAAMDGIVFFSGLGMFALYMVLTYRMGTPYHTGIRSVATIVLMLSAGVILSLVAYLKQSRAALKGKGGH